MATPAKRSRSEDTEPAAPAPLERTKSLTPMDETEKKWSTELACFPVAEALEFVKDLPAIFLGEEKNDADYMNMKTEVVLEVMELLKDIGEAGAATDNIVPRHALKNSFAWAWQQVIMLGWIVDDEEKNFAFIKARANIALQFARMHVERNIRNLELELVQELNEQEQEQQADN